MPTRFSVAFCYLLLFATPFCTSTDLDESISWPLRNGLGLASTIIIEGRTGKSTDSDKVFAIDLKENVNCVSDLWKADTMFHISVRYGENYVVLNTYEGDAYGREERHGDLAIGTDSKFTISITCLCDRFLVAINEQDYFSYKHRLPYTRIDHLIVRRNVLVKSITVLN